MAESANESKVAGSIRPPDYRAAVKTIRTIDAKKKAIAGKNSEIGDIWARVEGYKVPKKAGKVFAQLDALEHEERQNIVRALQGLIAASDWPAFEQDLADQAEGTVVEADFRKRNGNGNGGAKGMGEALDKARAHLGGDDAGDKTDVAAE